MKIRPSVDFFSLLAVRQWSSSGGIEARLRRSECECVCLYEYDAGRLWKRQPAGSAKFFKVFFLFVSLSLVHDTTFFKMQWQSSRCLNLPTFSTSFCCLQSASLSIHCLSTYDSLFLCVCVCFCSRWHTVCMCGEVHVHVWDNHCSYLLEFQLTDTVKTSKNSLFIAGIMSAFMCVCVYALGCLCVCVLFTHECSSVTDGLQTCVFI